MPREREDRTAFLVSDSIASERRMRTISSETTNFNFNECPDMGWLLLVAILSLVFPPFAIVALALVIVGVFAKGVVADPQDQSVKTKRKARHRRGSARPQDVNRRHVADSRFGTVIDVQWHPVLPPLRLPTPAPKGLARLRGP